MISRIRVMLAILLVLLGFGCFAQEQMVPTQRILPEDIEQDSIKMVGPLTTNKFLVRFTWTEAGAKKMLAFRREHAGQEVIMQVGSFERRVTLAPLDMKPPGWTEEGWLKRRTDKFFGVSEEDAKRLVEGLRKK